MMTRASIAGGALLLASLLLHLSASNEPVTVAPVDPARDRPTLRRPVALALTNQGKWLYVANQRSGTLSVIDTDKRQPVADVPVGRAVADLVAAPDGRHLLA